MIAIECPDCGEPVSRLAKACPHCGAANTGRTATLAVIASFAIFVAMVVVAAVAVVRWQKLPHLASQPPPFGAGERVQPARTPGDLGWLTDAMHECERQAGNEAQMLRFIVVPLASAAKDDPAWRAKSLNDIGNGILLTSDDMFEGLRNGSLRFYPKEYIFRIRDDATEATYQWKPSSGVAKFSTAEGDAIEAFKVQFRTLDRSRNADWGAAFVRQRGTCYWVNAIIGN